ncbi:hypothetical protein [Gordoniibacillus kamchatkensis]|uniref:hypothetical protein n=1 Tax=Gordoniibacillus kamchatkensis TaxID=1590651 RepID=UPI000AF9D3E4|nr:hypothetical protein [Paenibacillus sp. VKM B-2647]
MEQRAISTETCAPKKTQGAGQQHADFCIWIFPVSMTMDDDLADQSSQKINK